MTTDENIENRVSMYHAEVYIGLDLLEPGVHGVARGLAVLSCFSLFFGRAACEL